MYKNNTLYSLVTIAFFTIMIFGVNYHGYNNRVFASGKTTQTIESPEKAYAIWKENKVKGRILLYFDNFPHAKGLGNYLKFNEVPQLTSSNLIEFSIFNNIVRKIYFIVPDHNWEKFRLQKEMRPLRNMPGVERGLYIFLRSGVPLIAITPSSLPHLSEEALVYVNTQVFDYDQAMKLLSQKNITADIIISYQGHPK
jgi:hypothetical protein